MKLSAESKGVFPLAPTPFHDNGRIDFESIDRLVDFYVGCDCTGMTVLGVMIAPPHTLRTDDQIVSYYAQAVLAIGPDVPFCIQDYPLNTSVVMAPGVIRRIIADNPSCVMLTRTSRPGEGLHLARLADRTRDARVSILCGNNGLFLDFEPERGADGAMAGYPFPDMLVAHLQRLTKSATVFRKKRKHTVALVTYAGS